MVHLANNDLSLGELTVSQYRRWMSPDPSSAGCSYICKSLKVFFKRVCHFLCSCEWLNNKCLIQHLKVDESWIIESELTPQQHVKICAIAQLFAEFNKRNLNIQMSDGLQALIQEQNIQKIKQKSNPPSPIEQPNPVIKQPNYAKKKIKSPKKEAPKTPPASGSLKNATAKVTNKTTADDAPVSKAISFVKESSLPKKANESDSGIVPDIVSDPRIVNALNVLNPVAAIPSTSSARVLQAESLRSMMAMADAEKHRENHLNHEAFTISSGGTLETILTPGAALQSTAGVQNSKIKREYCLFFTVKGPKVEAFLKRMIEEYGLNSKNFCVALG